MALLPGKGLDSAIEEVKRAAQQTQITMAALHELIANINRGVLVFVETLESLRK